jgi:hypothetical protein
MIIQIDDHFNNIDLELEEIKLNSNNMKKNNLEEITKILAISENIASCW